ncbi:MAG: hypothetical protein FWE91_06600 [Defluviitaleaceae bacterium]|nr:hypothetical protein [Defluviitaleaceae bacterium]
MSRIRRFAVTLFTICFLTGCEPGTERIYPDRAEGGFIDFTELEAFAYYDGHIVLDGELEPFPRGQSAAISIAGKPDTEYHLSVILASGESSAAGLGLTLSDGEGRAVWSWRVAANTRPGRYNAVIIGGGDRLVLEISIEE